MKFSPLPFASGAYADEAMPWTQQDTVNMLPVPAEKGGAVSAAILRMVPGMVQKLAFSIEGTPVKPVRGAHNVEGQLFVVSGDTLYSVKPNWTYTSLGTIPGTGKVSMSHNQRSGGNELLIATGSSGYVYDTATNTLTRITDDGYPGATTVRYLNQYLVQIEPQRRFWFHSDLADAKQYSTLDRFEAESKPDKLMALEVSQGQLLAFGERTIEFFENAVSENAAFQRSGITIEKGAASPNATAVLDNTVYFIGSDGVVYRLEGYTPRRISTHAMEQAIAKCDLRRCFCMTWEDRGHAVFIASFPDGLTWWFDVSSGEWVRRETHGFNRWKVSCLTKWNGQWVAGDDTTGDLYALDWKAATDADRPLVRQRKFAALFSDFAKMRVNAIRFLLDTGLGGTGARKFQLCYSDDGGRNWSAWRDRETGAEGDFMDPVVFRRLGATSHRIFWVQDASAVRSDLISVGVNVG